MFKNLEGRGVMSKSKFKELFWKKMGLSKLFNGVVLLIRIFIRIVVFPIDFVNELIESVVDSYERKKNIRRSAEKARKKLTTFIVKGVGDKVNNVTDNSRVKVVKHFVIFLLEVASFVTTAIGMTIVARDITPAIAIIWAVVIQLLAGFLSIYSGKWNTVILAVCLAFSITSDYVCYVNAVFPYDAYIEEQYTSFKVSYDLALDRAFKLANEGESSDKSIDLAFDNIDNALSVIKESYGESIREKKTTELEDLKLKLLDTPPKIQYVIGHDITYNPKTGEAMMTPKYENVSNLRYEELKADIESLTLELKTINSINNSIKAIEKDINNMTNEQNEDGRSRAKKLWATITSTDTDETESLRANEEYSILSVQVLEIEKKINKIIKGIDISLSQLPEYNLSEIKNSDVNYEKLKTLKLPTFMEIREDINTNNNSGFDKIFNKVANLIESNFATNAMALKERAEQETDEKYASFIEVTTHLANEDDLLRTLIYGNSDTIGDSNEETHDAVVPLETAYKNVEYKDALSKGISYFWDSSKDRVQVYTRVVYAALADMLVLLIGFSLKRKRTYIYRINGRRDLTNEEPRLISEAFYNLSTCKIDDNTFEKGDYEIPDNKNLIENLELFISLFDPTPFMQGENLSTNYSLVCKMENVDKVNTAYRELINLLISLKYIKPISVKQYEAFVQYKLNKAIVIEDNTRSNTRNDVQVKNTDGYCYLMTEGFALYFYEKMNDLYNDEEISKFVNKEFVDSIDQEEEEKDAVGI